MRGAGCPGGPVPTSVGNYTLAALTSGGGSIVGFGSDRHAAVSSDGKNWTDVDLSSLLTSSVMGEAVYGGGRWVAVAAGGKVITSDDGGSTWDGRDSGSTTSLRSVAYDGSGFWVAVGDSGRLISSPDGATWTARTSQFGGTDAILKVRYANGVWVAVGGNGKISTSSNGTTWTAQTSTTATTLSLLEYGHGVWVAVGTTTIVTSPDGSSWTGRTSNLTATARCIASGTDGFVVGGDSGNLVFSADGTSWAQQTHPLGTSQMGAVGHDGAGEWIVWGQYDGSASSPDGQTWSAIATDVPPAGNIQTPNGLTFSSALGLWVAANFRQSVYVRPFTEPGIPDGASIVDVVAHVGWYVQGSNSATLGLQPRVGGANHGSELTSTFSSTVANDYWHLEETSISLGPLDLADLRAASSTIAARVRLTSSVSSRQGRLNYLYLEAVYQEAAGEVSLTGSSAGTSSASAVLSTLARSR